MRFSEWISPDRTRIMGASPPAGTWGLGAVPSALYAWDARTLSLVGQATLGKTPWQALWSPDGQRLLVVDAAVDVFDRDLKKLAAFDLHVPGEPPAVSHIAWLTNDRVLTLSGNGTLRVWQRRRPEAWWGVIELWEFWAAAVVTAWAAWRAVRDLRRWYGGGSMRSGDDRVATAVVVPD